MVCYQYHASYTVRTVQSPDTWYVVWSANCVVRIINNVTRERQSESNMIPGSKHRDMHRGIYGFGVHHGFTMAWLPVLIIILIEPMGKYRTGGTWELGRRRGLFPTTAAAYHWAHHGCSGSKASAPWEQSCLYPILYQKIGIQEMLNHQKHPKHVP